MRKKHFCEPKAVCLFCQPALFLCISFLTSRHIFKYFLKYSKYLLLSTATLVDNGDDSGTEFRKLVKMSNDLTETEETLRQLEASPTTVKDQISYLSLHMHATMQCAATGHQATVPALIGTLRLQKQELLVKKEKVYVDRQGLECELSKFRSVKDGPCSSCYEPALHMHRICRQPYHGGAFIGNHVKRALEAAVSQAISTAVIVAVEHVCPNSQDMKDASHVIAYRYSTLFMQFAACRRQYSSCSGVTAQQITRLANDICHIYGLCA